MRERHFDYGIKMWAWFGCELEEPIEKRVELFLKKNQIRFPQLVNLALDKCISEPQTIELEPVEPDAFMDVARKDYKKHKHAVDKLK